MTFPKIPGFQKVDMINEHYSIHQVKILKNNSLNDLKTDDKIRSFEYVRGYLSPLFDFCMQDIEKGDFHLDLP